MKHYENFPVASILCPKKLRFPIQTIYNFARIADDLADEGNLNFDERINLLNNYRDNLKLCYKNQINNKINNQWKKVFQDLIEVNKVHNLPENLLDDLLTAFIQDAYYTENKKSYKNFDDLVKNYCKFSANPIGRLLLYLYKINDKESLIQSDNISSSLQLINFWQDLSIDLPKNRFYIPNDLLEKYNLSLNDLISKKINKNSNKEVNLLLDELYRLTYNLMIKGKPLAKNLPGRIGWELRFVVQGGLRILKKIKNQNGNNLNQRLTINRLDFFSILFRTIIY